MGCCQVLVDEWRLGMWSTIDVNGKTIDVVSTFRPRPPLLTGIIKLGFLVWSIHLLVVSLVEQPDPKAFWLAYLTHWGLMLTIFYQLLSFSRMILPIAQEPVDFLTRLGWGVFTTVANVEVIITILYWTLEYKGGSVSYLNIMKHGILLLEVWFDGFVLNRIPIRMKQVLWVYLLAVTFLIWTGIHSASGIGNPYNSDNDPATDDDAIYRSVNWKERPVTGIIMGIAVLFVLIPILIITTYFLSTLLGRRYIENPDSDNPRTDANDDAEDPRTQAQEYVADPKTEAISY